MLWGWCLLFLAGQLVNADRFCNSGGNSGAESLSLDEYVLLWAWRGSQEGDYALASFLMWDVVNGSRSLGQLASHGVSRAILADLGVLHDRVWRPGIGHVQGALVRLWRQDEELWTRNSEGWP